MSYRYTSLVFSDINCIEHPSFNCCWVTVQVYEAGPLDLKLERPPLDRSIIITSAPKKLGRKKKEQKIKLTIFLINDPIANRYIEFVIEGGRTYLSYSRFLLFKLIKIFKGFSCSKAHCQKWIWSDNDRKSRFFNQSFIKTLDKSSATC